MRVALRMDVAHRAGDLPRRNLENLDVLRRVEDTRGASLDFRVAAARDQRGQPANLQFAADRDEHIGAADLEDEARFRIDLMRILIAPRERDDVHAIAADFARQ